MALGACGFPFPEGQLLVLDAEAVGALCRPSQSPFGGISNPAIIASALLPAAGKAKIPLLCSPRKLSVFCSRRRSGDRQGQDSVPGHSCHQEQLQAREVLSS